MDVSRHNWTTFWFFNLDCYIKFETIDDLQLTSLNNEFATTSNVYRVNGLITSKFGRLINIELNIIPVQMNDLNDKLFITFSNKIKPYSTNYHAVQYYATWTSSFTPLLLEVVPDEGIKSPNYANNHIANITLNSIIRGNIFFLANK